MTKEKTAEQIKSEIKALELQLAAIEAKNKEQIIKEAHKKIADNLAMMDKLFDECRKIADEHEITFSWDGPGYGSGGWYESGEWQSSSSSC